MPNEDFIFAVCPEQNGEVLAAIYYSYNTKYLHYIDSGCGRIFFIFHIILTARSAKPIAEEH